MWGLALLCLGAGALSGCSDAIYFYQRSTVGFNAAASTPEGAGYVRLGYGRRFLAAVPEKDGGEAVSIVSCSTIDKNGMYDIRVSENLMTGDAATKFAKNVKKDGSKEGSAVKCFSDQ
tara:strand:- start:1292 stop:1645 length:354 start_codon:yes stop_codon:yes gene_type:complete